MKKKIAILGSTGSIGKSTLDIIEKDLKNFSIVLLTANTNYTILARQAKKFKAENVLIKDKNLINKLKHLLKKTKTKVYAGDISENNIISRKIDFTMSSIVGIAGLQPTIDAIKFSREVALANKESIICAWNIILSYSKKYKTKIFPVDSEHFSIMQLTKEITNDKIKEILITASGGPFLNTPLKKLNRVKPNQAIKHPNWSMGKKISVDSSNLMNKVFEVIEAYKLFNFDKSKYKIVIHPQSYVHSIIRFKNGLTKMILYNTDMKIPIANILYRDKKYVYDKANFNLDILNKLTFYKVNSKKFPSVKLINKCLNMGFSTPIIVNASNEILVSQFLKGKIGFLDIVSIINKILKDKDFKFYAKRKPRSLKDIKITDNWARLKTLKMCVR